MKALAKSTMFRWVVILTDLKNMADCHE
jgi:hypothetical protein